jgi:hypothetical protein
VAERRVWTSMDAYGQGEAHSKTAGCRFDSCPTCPFSAQCNSSLKRFVLYIEAVCDVVTLCSPGSIRIVCRVFRINVQAPSKKRCCPISRCPRTGWQQQPAAILPYSFSITIGVIQISIVARRLWNRMGANWLERFLCGAAHLFTSSSFANAPNLIAKEGAISWIELHRDDACRS